MQALSIITALFLHVNTDARHSGVPSPTKWWESRKGARLCTCGFARTGNIWDTTVLYGKLFGSKKIPLLLLYKCTLGVCACVCVLYACVRVCVVCV